MKPTFKDNNKRDFHATCSGEEIKQGINCQYKYVNMFGPKTLILWNTGRISTRNGHNNKGLI